MWEKIVLNLLSNAFKFTFDGGIAVTSGPAGGVELAVRDTGIGHPAGGDATGSSSDSTASKTREGARTRAPASAWRWCRSW